tara:strand:+ start:19 stop:309 length:291 start_codon:yes stop_codon:yes gene_type:complete
MAKTKEKILDVKERKDKVSEVHLKEMVNAANSINALQFNIGRLEAQKHKLLHELALSNDNISLIQDKMMEEYGTFDINLTDGTINWPKEEEKSDEK